MSDAAPVRHAPFGRFEADGSGVARRGSRVMLVWCESPPQRVGVTFVTSGWLLAVWTDWQEGSVGTVCVV